LVVYRGLLGTQTTTTISLFRCHVDQGIDAVNGVFADLRPNVPAGLPIGFSADPAGRIATPNLAVLATGR
jgi:hypothetical protein